MFRRIVCTLMAGAVMLAGAPSASAETAYREVELPAPHSMYVMGDSIATGFGLEGYADGKDKCRSYANILKDKYSPLMPPDCPFTLTNAAVDGNTSDDLLTLLKSGQCDEGLSNADCVVVSIGGNDILHALWELLSETGVGADSQADAGALVKLMLSMGKLKEKLDRNLTAFEKNLDEIAAYIQGKTGGAFILQTLYDPLQEFKLVPGLSDIAKEKIGKLNEIIRSHSAQGYTVCEVAPQFDGKAKELTNISKIDIHPNAEGHKLIAEALDKTITARKYSYQQAYEAETAAAPDDDVTKLQGNSLVVVIVCVACALAAGGAAVFIVRKKR